jgi:hypothetical protein
MAITLSFLCCAKSSNEEVEQVARVALAVSVAGGGTAADAGATGPTCRSFDLIGRRDYNPPRIVPGEISFASAVSVEIPASLPVTKGESGRGVALVDISKAGSRKADVVHVICLYQGALLDLRKPKCDEAERRARAGLYVLRSCSHRLVAGDKVLATGIVLRVLDGDKKAGPTEVEIVSNCPADQPKIVVSPLPSTSDFFKVLMSGGPPNNPRTPLPTPSHQIVTIPPAFQATGDNAPGTPEHEIGLQPIDLRTEKLR